MYAPKQISLCAASSGAKQHQEPPAPRANTACLTLECVVGSWDMTACSHPQTNICSLFPDQVFVCCVLALVYFSVERPVEDRYFEATTARQDVKLSACTYFWPLYIPLWPTRSGTDSMVALYRFCGPWHRLLDLGAVHAETEPIFLREPL